MISVEVDGRIDVIDEVADACRHGLHLPGEPIHRYPGLGQDSGSQERRSGRGTRRAHVQALVPLDNGRTPGLAVPVGIQTEVMFRCELWWSTPRRRKPYALLRWMSRS